MPLRENQGMETVEMETVVKELAEVLELVQAAVLVVVQAVEARVEKEVKSLLQNHNYSSIICKSGNSLKDYRFSFVDILQLDTIKNFYMMNNFPYNYFINLE
jgi:hypothetical protein